MLGHCFAVHLSNVCTEFANDSRSFGRLLVHLKYKYTCVLHAFTNGMCVHLVLFCCFSLFITSSLNVFFCVGSTFFSHIRSFVCLVVLVWLVLHAALQL